jgi:hypothetical protein
VIVDDYAIMQSCREAVQFFRTARGIVDSIQPIDSASVYRRKSEAR